MHTIGILFKIAPILQSMLANSHFTALHAGMRGEAKLLTPFVQSGSFKSKYSLQKLLLSELADANLAEIFVGLKTR
jgi:hypothetical protein